jgi:hypothetical protein
MPLARRQLLCFELGVVAGLVLLAVLAHGKSGVWHAISLAALGYAVGLTSHVVLVVLGWKPPFARRRRQR